ncbi:MAG: pseudouridylate synthase [Bacteroidaceae bacterium]|nr:pseudouridylate synthase [Bacteroidaceae bacterium]
MNAKEPTENFLRSIDIHELLPQQEPFVMIGTLVKFDMTRTVTELTVSADNLFVDNGYFSASGLIENIAQTCAARIGYVNKYILLKGIQLGFIGAIRNLQVNELPKVGDTITTTVDVLEEVFGMTLANAVVTCGDKVLVTSEMKIAVREAE